LTTLSLAGGKILIVYTFDFPSFLSRVRGPSAGIIEPLVEGSTLDLRVTSAGLEAVIVADLGYLGSSGCLIPSFFLRAYVKAFL